MKFLKTLGVITLCIIIIFSVGCSSVKNSSDSRKLKKKQFEIEYPRDWKRFGLYGYYYLRPKSYDSEVVNIELNNISLVNKVITKAPQENYFDVLEKHVKSPENGENKFTFNIEKLSESSTFLYRIDYYRTFKNFDGVFKVKEYFYETNDGLTFISVQFEKRLYEVYEKDIDAIVNSFKVRGL